MEKLTKIEIKKIQKADKLIIGSVIGNLVAQDYLPGVERKTFEIEDIKNLPDEIKSIFGIELSIIENLDKCKIEMQENIEGTEVKLSANFVYLRDSLVGPKKLKVFIEGQRSFRKQSKKIAYNEFYGKFLNKIQKAERIIKKAKEMVQEKLNAISEAFYTFEVAEKLGYSKDEVLNAIDLLIGYETAENKKQFLSENGFTGVENFGIYNATDDGFGHQRVVTYSIDFFKKDVRTVTGSSDD